MRLSPPSSISLGTDLPDRAKGGSFAQLAAGAVAEYSSTRAGADFSTWVPLVDAAESLGGCSYHVDRLLLYNWSLCRSADLAWSPATSAGVPCNPEVSGNCLTLLPVVDACESNSDLFASYRRCTRWALVKRPQLVRLAARPGPGQLVQLLRPRPGIKVLMPAIGLVGMIPPT